MIKKIKTYGIPVNLIQKLIIKNKVSIRITIKKSTS